MTAKRAVMWVKNLAILTVNVFRRGSRINTDRLPKRTSRAQASRGFRGHAPPQNFLDFNSLKSPFPGFPSLSDRILANSVHLG